MLSTLIGSTVISSVFVGPDIVAGFLVTTPTPSTNSKASSSCRSLKLPVATTVSLSFLGVKVIPVITLPKCGATAEIVLFTLGPMLFIRACIICGASKSLILDSFLATTSSFVHTTTLLLTLGLSKDNT